MNCENCRWHSFPNASSTDMKTLLEIVISGITATEKTTVLNKTDKTWVHLVEQKVPWLTMFELCKAEVKLRKRSERKPNHLWKLNLILTRTKKCQAITEPENIWICFVFKSTEEDISRNVFQKTISFPYRERQKRMHFRKCQNKSIQGFIDSTMTMILYLPTEHHRELLKVPLCLSKTLSGETARYLQVHQNMSGPQKSVGF